MLCRTQLHNFNTTVRYRAYDAPQTYSWLGEGRRGIPLPWRGGSLPIPHPVETRCLLAPRSAHPPKYGSRWRHCVTAVVFSISYVRFDVYLSPIYTIQPVVKQVVKLVVSCIQTFNRFDNRLYRVCSWLSNRLYNPVWQTVEQTVAVRSSGCQFDNRFDNRLYRVNGTLRATL